MESDRKIINYKENTKNNFVIKKKGYGNKYFNAYTIAYFFNKEETSKGRIKDVPYVVICYRDEQERETIASVFTRALYDNWSGNEVNSQYTRAHTWIKFVNWLLVKKEKRYPSLKRWSEMTLEMVIDYLNSIRHDVTYERHIYIEETIRNMYKVLLENGMLSKIELKTIDSNTLKKLGLKRPIRRSNKGKISHRLPKVLINDFILISEKETADITFGVILGICAGLRVGEIVNLSRGAVSPLGIDEYILYVRDRYFRKDVSSPRTRGEVKKPRNQRVYKSVVIDCFGEDKLNKSYYTHIDTYKSIDTPNALFIDNDGRAMTAQTFMNRFAKLKRKFIKYLKDSEDDLLFSYGSALEKKKWKTHIMRGIFSNSIAERTKSPLSTAKARDDNQLATSLDYITDTDDMIETMERAVPEQRRENFKREPLPINKFKPKQKKEEK